MEQNWISNFKIFIWGAFDYVGLLIPNLVTTLWLSYSDYSGPLAWLFLITILGFVIQTVTFIHSRNLLTHISDSVLLILAILVLILLLIMQHTLNIHVFLVIYLLFFGLISVVISSCIVSIYKSKK